MTELSVFEKIAQGEIPSYQLWENEEFMAFLSIGPLAPGHTLVVPKENWADYVFDLPDERYGRLMAATKEVAQLIEPKLDCDRLLVWVEGFEVPHVHVHLIPAKQGQGLRKLDPGTMTDDEFKAIQAKILG